MLNTNNFTYFSTSFLYIRIVLCPIIGQAIYTSKTPKENIKFTRSDVTLYALKHLDKIDNFCRQQLKTTDANSINALHYNNLLLKTKKIRDAYNKPDND